MTIKTTQGIRNQHYRRISQWLGGQEVFTGPPNATQVTPCCSDPLEGDQCVSVYAQGLSGRVPPPAVALASASATSDHHRCTQESLAPTRVKMHPAVEQLFSQYRPPPSSSHSTSSTATQMDPRYGYVAPRTAYDNLSVPPAVSPMVPPAVSAPPPQSSAPAHPSRFASQAETAPSAAQVDALVTAVIAEHRAKVFEAQQALQQEASRAQTFATRYDTAQSDLQSVKMQLAAAQTTMAAWKSSPPNQAEMDMLAARLHAKDRELQQAREELDKKESANRASTSALARQKQDVEARLKALTAELVGSRTEAEAERTRRVEVERKRVQMEEKLRSASQPKSGSSSTTALLRELDDVKNKLKHHEEQERRQLGSIAQVEGEKEKLLDKQKSLRKEASALRAEVDILREGRKDQERLQKDKQSLRHRLEDADEELAKSQKEIRRLQRQVLHLDKERRAFKEELAELRSIVTQRDARHVHDNPSRLGRHEMRQTDELPDDDDPPEEEPETEVKIVLHAPVPRTLADIPSLVAQSTYAPSFAPSKEVAAEDPPAPTPRRTLDDLRALYGPPQPPADPYANLEEALGQGDVTRFDEEHSRTNLSSLASAKPITKTDHKPAKEWEKFYSEVSASV